MPTRSKAKSNAPSSSAPPQPAPIISANRGGIQAEFNKAFASLAGAKKVLAGLTDGTTAAFKSALLDFLDELVRFSFFCPLPIFH